MGGKIGAYIKMVNVMIGMVIYVSVIFLRQLFKGPDLMHAFLIRKKWAEFSTRVLGVDLEVIGDLPEQTGIIISNHRSMIDPVIQLAVMYALPVAKAEISKYPIVGQAAKTTGIIFLERNNKQNRFATRSIIRDKIEQGYNVLVYPEGTVGTQETTRSFSKGSFEIAAEESIPILPIAIEYGHEDHLWSSTDTLLQHCIKSLSRKQMKVKLYIGRPLLMDNSWTLMKTTQEWINEKLLVAQRSWVH